MVGWQKKSIVTLLREEQGHQRNWYRRFRGSMAKRTKATSPRADTAVLRLSILCLQLALVEQAHVLTDKVDRPTIGLGRQTHCKSSDNLNGALICQALFSSFLCNKLIMLLPFCRWICGGIKRSNNLLWGHQENVTKRRTRDVGLRPHPQPLQAQDPGKETAAHLVSLPTWTPSCPHYVDSWVKADLSPLLTLGRIRSMEPTEPGMKQPGSRNLPDRTQKWINSWNWEGLSEIGKK